MDELRPKHKPPFADVDCIGVGRCDYVRRDSGYAGYEMHN